MQITGSVVNSTLPGKIFACTCTRIVTMQQPLARISSQLLPACRFILHPTSRFVCQSAGFLSARKAFFVGRGVCSVLLNSHRNYIRGEDQSRERPGNDAGDDTIDRNEKIIDLGKEGKWKDILRLFEKEKDQFDSGNWEKMFSQLSRVRDMNRRDPLFLSFVNEYGRCLRNRGLDWARLQGLANVVHAIGKMQMKKNLRKSILAFVMKKENARKIVRQGNTQDIANMAWAFAALNEPSRIFFGQIEKRAGALVQSGTEQAIADIAWSFAKLDIKSPHLFAEIEKRVVWLAKNGNAQDIADTAWAFAKQEVESPELFAEIEKRSDWLVRNGTPETVANTAWAFAKSKVESSKLFAEIEKCAVSLVQEGTPRNVANTAWASVTLGMESPKLFTEIEKCAVSLVRNGDVQDVTKIIWAVTKSKYISPNLMDESNKRGAWLVRNGSEQEIATSAIAFATFGYDASTFFTAVAKNFSKLIIYGEQHHAANVCYAMAILDLGKKYFDEFSQLWAPAVHMDPLMFTDEELRQLAKVYAFCTAYGMTIQPFPFYMRDAMDDAEIRFSMEPSTQSKHQGEVAQILERLGLDYEEEVSPFEEDRYDHGLITMDITCKSHMLAIECHGESHFLKELGNGKVTQQENGATIAKRRFLQRRGWTVINIDDRDWINAEKTNSQLEYLRERLYQVGIKV